jgi:hypothetical protein
VERCLSREGVEKLGNDAGTNACEVLTDRPTEAAFWQLRSQSPASDLVQRLEPAPAFTIEVVDGRDFVRKRTYRHPVVKLVTLLDVYRKVATRHDWHGQ